MGAPSGRTTTDADDDDDDDEEEVGKPALFFDAIDEFPFYDCLPPPEEPSASASASEVSATDSSTKVVPSVLRRRSIGRGSKVAVVDSEFVSRERNVRFYRHSKEEDGEIERKGTGLKGDSESGNSVVDSVLTDEVSLSAVGGGFDNDGKGRGDVDDGDSIGSSSQVDGSESHGGLLVYVAGLIIEAIGIQLKLLFKFFRFPFRVLYISCLFVVDPLGTIRRVRGYLIRKLLRVLNVIRAIVSPYLLQRFGESKSLVKILLRYGWGLLSAGYVCVVLFSFLVFASVASGFVMGVLVEKPIKIHEKMNFDYTKDSPVAYLPVVSCAGLAECAGKCEGMFGVENNGGAQIVPLRHKLSTTVSLTLPESEYNKNLGIFQVRVDFLSASGEIIASRRHPCMLLFKSEPIRLLLTILKIVPLITGYISESQTLDVKFRGFTEGDVHTACLRLVIEPRAEFPPGAGIPEVYDASLTIESELPFVKRVLWFWRRTVFVWLTMVFFIMELLLALVCCRPLILPRTSSSNVVARTATARSPPPVQ